MRALRARGAADMPPANSSIGDRKIGSIDSSTATASTPMNQHATRPSRPEVISPVASPTLFLSPTSLSERQDLINSAGSAAQAAHTAPASLNVVGMHRWEGRILDIDGDVFSAELTPIDHDGPPLVADFDLMLLETDDAEVGPESGFYLTTRIIEVNGRKEATSSLRLRRLGRWTEKELEEARNEARKLGQVLAQYAE